MDEKQIRTVQYDTTVVHICIWDTARLESSLSGMTSYWNPGDHISNYTKPVTTVWPRFTRVYVFTVFNPDTAKQLTVNGTFELGNADFDSDYIYNPAGSGINQDGRYTISDDPSQENVNYAACSDHTSGEGKMMVVNGDTVEEKVLWKQHVPSFTPATTLAFSAWIQNVSNEQGNAVNSAEIQFRVNDSLIGDPFEASSDICEWKQFYIFWESEDVQHADISIVNQSPDPDGANFALDDISFTPLVMDRDIFLVVVHELPDIDLGSDTLLSFGSSLTLDAGYFQGASYLWSTGDTTQTIVIDNVTEDLVVGVLVDEFGCLGEDEIKVSVGCNITIPTAFTPNGDYMNDLFYVYGPGLRDFDLKIYNRLGALVFRSEDQGIGWDGTFDNVKQAPNVYVYKLNATCPDGNSISKKGFVTLLR